MYENLSISRYHVHFITEGSIRLPGYTGSAFRGVLGHSMKSVRYGTGSGCSQCPVRSECRYSNPYAYLFKAPADYPLVARNLAKIGKQVRDLPPPFLIDPPDGGRYNSGDTLSLSLTLVGEAIRFFPFMVCAFESISDRFMGTDRERGRLRLVSIFDGSDGSRGSAPLYTSNNGRISGQARVLNFPAVRQSLEESFSGKPVPDRILIDFLTPFRFKYHGRLGVEPDFSILMKNVLRRLNLLSVHSPMEGEPDFSGLVRRAASVSTQESRIKWIDWDRYSNRQKGHMKFGGFVGSIGFSGNLKEFFSFLAMGQYVNIGKACTFGLGKYTCRGGNGDREEEIFHVSF